MVTQSHERERTAEVVRKAFYTELGPKLTGSQPVNLRVAVKSFWVPGVFGTIMIGGTAGMTAGVELVDTKSGKILATFDASQGRASAAALGGVGGALINAAVDSNSADGRAGRLARNFANDYADWLIPKP